MMILDPQQEKYWKEFHRLAAAKARMAIAILDSPRLEHLLRERGLKLTSAEDVALYSAAEEAARKYGMEVLELSLRLLELRNVAPK
jgi:hypothetical protein